MVTKEQCIALALINAVYACHLALEDGDPSLETLAVNRWSEKAGIDSKVVFATGYKLWKTFGFQKIEEIERRIIASI